MLPDPTDLSGPRDKVGCISWSNPVGPPVAVSITSVGS